MYLINPFSLKSANTDPIEVSQKTISDNNTQNVLNLPITDLNISKVNKNTGKKLKSSKKKRWTDREDLLLIKYVSMNYKWAEIAKKIKGRQGKQCRERWHNHLNPMTKKEPWENHEEWLLFLCHRLMGNKWSLISKHIKGRSDNSIKNHWNANMKKKEQGFKEKLETI